jgi:hypothetical protein
MENNILGGLTGLPPNMTAKDWAKITDTTGTINNNPLSVNKNTSAMKTYILKDDFISGVLVPSGKPNILFKKGDKVSGVPYERHMVTNKMGIDSKPTVKDAYVENSDRLVFIPLEFLTEVTSSTNETTTPNSKELAISNHQLLQYAVIGLVLYIIFIK